MTRWSKQDTDFVIDNYSALGACTVAGKLGRSIASVKHKASRLGVSLSGEALSSRLAESAKMAHAVMGGMTGENNPNWKGGISKDNYHYKKLQKQRYPEKVRARELVNRAIARMELERKPCDVCGDKNSQAHHEDYDKPLEVVWLCRKHHRELHLSK